MFKDRVEVPPILLNLKIFGKIFHKYLIDLRASYNIMPLSICHKLGMNPQLTNMVMIQLEKIEVKVIGVLKDMHI